MKHKIFQQVKTTVFAIMKNLKQDQEAKKFKRINLTKPANSHLVL